MLRHRATIACAFLGLLASAGCGGSSSSSTGSPDSGAGTGGSSGSATGGSSGTGVGGSSGTGVGGSSGTGVGGVGGVGGTSTGGSAGTAGTGGAAGGSGSCVVDADCPNQGICGYPEADACSAKGSCFPAPGGTCQAYSPGCACDGSVINIVCNGLPDGYAPKPLAHTGECATGDAGSKSFACGNTLFCDATTQYCKIGEGGACCNPPSYSCEAIPTTCAQNHSCACIQTAVGGQQCTDAGGGVTVTFQYP